MSFVKYYVVCVFSNWNNHPHKKTTKKQQLWSRFFQVRFPYRDFKRDWHPGDRFCRCRSIKMRFYRHIDIYKVEFMLNKYLKRWVQFVDTVIWVTNTTEYTELIGSEVASKWFSHSWMIARTLPKQAHPGRRSPRARFAGTGGFAARGGGHIICAN